MNYKQLVVALAIAGLLMMAFGFQFAKGEPTPGANPSNVPLTTPTMGSIVPQVTETGKIALSLDGLGVYPGTTGVIQVQKPSASATVRSAFMAAATTGFTGYRLSAGDIKIDGNNFVWSIETVSGISSWNYWGDVTNLVKAKIDAAPAGRVDFTVTETNTYSIDGELLAVIFDDPTLTTDNTIVLLFGAQAVGGDTFHIGLGSPLTADSLTHPLDLSLGISYGYQPSGQYSIVNVNGQRMTTSAGGQDDGAGANGALLTVGGLDDSDANPSNPLATDSGGPLYDDELYNLNPFVNVGDTTINVFTQNPSTDDNIFFAALNLQAQVAVVGEGIVLSPPSAGNTVGQYHTVTATLQDTNGHSIVGRPVTFTIISGPNAGQTTTADSDGNGQTTFTYTSTAEGTDTIKASFVNNLGQTINSNSVTKTWSPLIVTNMYLSMNAPLAMDHGNTMVYTIFYHNFGGNPALNVVLQATLSPSVVFASASDGGTFNSATNVVTWSIGSLPAFPAGHGSRTVTVSIPSSVPEGTLISSSAVVSTTTLETDYSDNSASASTKITHSDLPQNTAIGPIISYSNNEPVVHWTTPITFTYYDAAAISVDIRIHINDGGADIVDVMTGPAPTWTYTTTFYPRHGHATVTYTPHYPSGTTSTVSFNIHIDPAGYVYDVNTNARIQGATVWLQRPDGSGGWENVPTGLALMVPDVNPLTTDVNGQYQWDTLVGLIGCMLKH